MTPTLHEHPFAAYCWKALIALYERGVDVDRRFVGDAQDRARLAQLWPMGSIPVLVDGDLTLAESSAIVEQLDRARRRAGGWCPPTRAPRCRRGSGIG